MNIKTWIYFSLTATTVLLFSCQSEDSQEQEPNVLETSQSTLDNSRAESEFESANNLMQQAMEDFQTEITSSATTEYSAEFESYNSTSACATITLYRNETPKRIEIDFGTEGCLGLDGRIRKGIINITYTGFYRVNGTVIKTTFDNHFVNSGNGDVKVEGTKTVTNITEEGENITHTVQVLGGKLTFPDTNTITWESTRTREWIEGASTFLNLSDDIHEVTGSYSGVNRNGDPFIANITIPLEIKTSCWINSLSSTTPFRPSKGEITFNPNSSLPLVINYGEGECDAVFTVTFAGSTFTIGG